MTFYCMHDAPSGVQNKTTFINKSGRNIEKGEIHSVQCSVDIFKSGIRR